MSTATAEQIPAELSKAPAEQSVADLLYGPAEGATVEPSVLDRPAQTQDTEPAPDTKPDASLPAPAKEEPPKAPEDKDPVKEQLDRQSAANKRLGRDNAELKQRFDQLMQKHEELIARANGDEPPKKPALSEDQIRAQENFRGRDLASKPVAYGIYGEQEVEQSVYADESPYVELVKDKPWIHFEVTRHAQPAIAAMQALKRETFVKKYGDDPTKWEEKIAAALKPKLFEEFQKQYTAPVVGKEVPSVTGARNSGSAPAPREKSLADYLYGGS